MLAAHLRGSFRYRFATSDRFADANQKRPVGRVEPQRQVGRLLACPVLALPDGNVWTVRRLPGRRACPPRESRGTRMFRLERAKNRETLLLGHAFDVHPLIIHPQMPGGQLGSLQPKRPVAGGSQLLPSCHLRRLPLPTAA